MFETDTASDQLADCLVYIVDGKVQYGERRGEVIRLGIEDDPVSACQMQCQDAHGLGCYIETERLAVERFRAIQIIDGEATERLTIS